MKSNAALRTKSVEPAPAPAPAAPRLGITEQLQAAGLVRIPGILFPAAFSPKSLPAAQAGSRRTRIWELASTLHCSIVGTCLTTGELRVLLKKLDPTIDRNAMDHDLHSMAVGSAGRNDEASKQIQKALDARHKVAITRFAKAHDVDGLRACWEEALQSGDIAGGYWAVLTHPAATEELVRRAFGDVHMLSHLVGSANRADIRKLHELERQNTELTETLARQHAQLRDGIVAREEKIRELGAALAARIERETTGPVQDAASSELATLEGLVKSLRKQLDVEIRRRERAERKAEDLSLTKVGEESARAKAEEEAKALREELDAAEESLAALSGEGERAAPHWNLDGRTVLYVGGRSHQIAGLRALVERSAGTWLHHDGGVEERGDLLPGLVSRADIAVCPIDCVSHAAALALKRLCRQAEKPFVPLRGSGMGSLLRAIRAVEPPVAAEGGGGDLLSSRNA